MEPKGNQLVEGECVNPINPGIFLYTQPTGGSPYVQRPALQNSRGNFPILSRDPSF